MELKYNVLMSQTKEWSDNLKNTNNFSNLRIIGDRQCLMSLYPNNKIDTKLSLIKY